MLMDVIQTGHCNFSVEVQSDGQGEWRWGGSAARMQRGLPPRAPTWSALRCTSAVPRCAAHALRCTCACSNSGLLPCRPLAGVFDGRPATFYQSPWMNSMWVEGVEGVGGGVLSRRGRDKRRGQGQLAAAL